MMNQRTMMFSAQLLAMIIAMHAGAAVVCSDDANGHHELVVYGATPGGVACAVRAAREGLDVLLVSHTEHLGGMLTNGLSTMDTLYNGRRAPLYDELRQRIYDHYRDTYGADSPQYQAAQPGHPKTRYEAHVVERLINDLLHAEPRITIVTGYYPISAERNGSLLASVTFQKMDGEKQQIISADVFADCSYEADLAAVAGVPYRVGREARDEFNEPHAGLIYMREVSWPPADVPEELLGPARRLNLYRYQQWFETIEAASTGAADPSVQGYNMRTIVTRDPNNRVPIDKPTEYDPELLRTFGHGNPERPGLSMPNQKFGLNLPKLIGQQDPYVDGDWQTRRDVTQLHRDATLALLYFRQHDPSVPEAIRKEWLEYGLPQDEFADNGHMPYEIYARETRRIRGRAVFTEHDARLAPGLERAPVHHTSISITEWFLDSHACTPRDVPGSEQEGMVMLKNQTFPGQVPYQTLLPENLDNLLVPLCLSSTHVGWGTIRLEPTWMSICEAAAHAVVLANHQQITPAQINADELVRQLADRRVMLSFFNDIEGHTDADWYPAIQYLGTQGYFGTYEARPDEPLTAPLAKSGPISSNNTFAMASSPTDAAIMRPRAEQANGDIVTAGEFAKSLTTSLPDTEPNQSKIQRLLTQLSIDPKEPITRGDACRLIYAATKHEQLRNRASE
ncbi:MAG: FAD-dependent oxidoreductase [Planctomycetaceae bacterium]